MNSLEQAGHRPVILYRLFFAMIFTVVFFLASHSPCFATTVVLQWDPVTAQGFAGYKVYYQADSSAQPFSGTGATQGSSPVDVHIPSPDAQNHINATIGGLDPTHAYYFAVTSYYDTGVESAYSNIIYVPEMVSPTVAISSPANNATVSGSVSVTASASDNVGVTKVEFYLNGTLLATDTSTPYTYSWDTSALAAGTYALSAMAYDAAGNVGQSSAVSVTVVKDTTPPAVSVTSPANSATVSGTVAITASASDNVGVSKVEFYENGTLLYATNVSPYSYSWNTTTVTNGSYTLTAKAYDASGNSAQSGNITVTVNNPLPDTTAPTVTAFTLPSTGTSFTIPVSSFTATDNVGVSGYCITTTNSSAGCTWSGTAPSSVTFTGTGSQTAWAWAKDTAGNVSAGVSAATTITMSSITIGETSILTGDDSGNGNLLLAQSATLGQAATLQSLSFYVTTASGTLRLGIYDASGAGGGPGTLVASTAELTPTSGWNTATVTAPVLLNAGTYWLAYLPSSNNLHFRTTATGSTGKYYSYTYGTLPSAFSAAPTTIAAHWSFYATLAIGDTTAPVVSAFTLPATSTSLTVAVSSFTASDAVGVTGYLITESATVPAATAAGWSTAVPASFTFSATGSKTAYAWAKDLAGNVSASRSASVSITLPDTTAPVVSAFTLPATATSLTVTVSSLTASDAVGVTGYLITESATVPAATAAGWSTAVPTSFTFSATGSKTAYAWAKDAAGNISASRSASVSITLPDTTVPTVSITAPAAGATVGGTVTVSATASDNVGVSKVEFYVNGILQSLSSSVPYSFSWNTASVANGSYILSAKAYDAAGNVGQSANVAATVNNSVQDITPPIVVIKSPSAGVKVGSSVTINASATDNVAVVKMQLYIDGVLKTQVNGGTLNWTWKTTNYARGAHVLKVTAYDAANNSGSQSITVNR